MMSPLSLEALTRERLETLHDEARRHCLLRAQTLSPRRRLALTLKAWAERLEPELSQSRPAGRLGRNTPFPS
ncbi:MAG: hypothetical protein M3498_15770 [Deinococcota bacterium]|jgi:hypothetical protein|nr:hypothetical protein [Deinococcota bacterium]MDQ3460738.1 hypothetical protein [Deinococcota bacterium]